MPDALMASAQDDIQLDSSAIGFSEPGNGVTPQGYSVVGFTALENEVVAQTVPIGTPQETLILPDSYHLVEDVNLPIITVTVEVAVQSPALAAGSASALLEFPDLAFTIEPGSTVSKTKLTIEDTAYDKTNHSLQMNNTATPSIHSQGANMQGIGMLAASGTEFATTVSVGSYINLFEVDESKFLVNRAAIQVTNNHLLIPTPGTTCPEVITA